MIALLPNNALQESVKGCAVSVAGAGEQFAPAAPDAGFPRRTIGLTTRRIGRWRVDF